MQESSFQSKLFQFKLKLWNNGKQDFYRGILDYRRENFIVVNSLNLNVSGVLAWLISNEPWFKQFYTLKNEKRDYDAHWMVTMYEEILTSS